MIYFTTQQAAKKLGIGLTTLIRYIVEKNVPAPPSTQIGKRDVRAWTEEDIERVRKLLPKIANGRKTRYQKLRDKQGTQPRAAARQKPKRRPTKEKK
jgi:predicted DNA-binding transcriptional regulator AlpA